jgi:hypothetical protein
MIAEQEIEKQIKTILKNTIVNNRRFLIDPDLLPVFDKADQTDWVKL